MSRRIARCPSFSEELLTKVNSLKVDQVVPSAIATDAKTDPLLQSLQTVGVLMNVAEGVRQEPCHHGKRRKVTGYSMFIDCDPSKAHQGSLETQHKETTRLHF
jgi:hypothetical protein